MKHFAGLLVVLMGCRPAPSHWALTAPSPAHAPPYLVFSNVGDDILQECEVFYTRIEAQKEQLHCLARVSVDAAKVRASNDSEPLF